MAEHLILISDRPVNDYEAFFVDLMRGLDKHKVRSLAVAAILEEAEEDGYDALTAYFNASLRDRCYASDLIRTDVTYKIAQDAVRDMLDLTEPDEEEH